MARPANHVSRVEHVTEERSAQTDDRSLGELFSDLARETETLVKQEIQLAKTEMSQKAASVGIDIGYMAGGALIAYAGFLVVLAFVVLWLGQVIPMWASALIVGVVVLAIGGGLAYSGLNKLKNTNMAPQKTIETLQEDAQWAKEQTS